MLPAGRVIVLIDAFQSIDQVLGVGGHIERHVVYLSLHTQRVLRLSSDLQMSKLEDQND
jgi:hypothetical protein